MSVAAPAAISARLRYSLDIDNDEAEINVNATCQWLKKRRLNISARVRSWTSTPHNETLGRQAESAEIASPAVCVCKSLLYTASKSSRPTRTRCEERGTCAVAGKWSRATG